MFGHMGLYELLLILLIAIIIFGAGRIPEIAKSIGQGIKEFKKTRDDVADSIESGPAGKADDKKG